MKATVRKLTNFNLVLDTNEMTSGKKSSQSEISAYKAEHSTIRTQIYYIKCYDVPTFVMGHYVRHHIGVEKYVRSQRADRGGSKNSDRMTPTDFSLCLNAQSIINIMRARLCNKASKETRQLAHLIRNEILNIDYHLGCVLVPNCVYRNGICPEPKSCGKVKEYLDGKYAYYRGLFE